MNQDSASIGDPDDSSKKKKGVCSEELVTDRELPQDHASGEGKAREDEDEDVSANGPSAAVARHKQRSKKSETDNVHAVTNHTVFKSKQDARSLRFTVDSERRGHVNSARKPIFSRRNLNFNELRRSKVEREAMGPLERAKLRIKRASTAAPTESETERSINNRQYSIPPLEDEGKSLLFGFRVFFSMRFVDLMFWMFKTSFLNVIIVFLINYLVFINVFTAIIYGVVSQSNRAGVVCIDGWDYDGSGGGRGLNWEISFSLSWTSFSTVGFGTVSPDIVAHCYGLRYACAIEAFLGVIYAGFCGAIFYAKFSRLMGRAQVTFSSTICIQFGAGANKQQEECLSSSRPSKALESPFPVLEFRVVNMRANEKGCEILDATISCLGCVHVADSQQPVLSSPREGSIKDNERPSSSVIRVAGSSDSDSIRRDKQNSGSILCDDITGVNEKIGLLKQKYLNLNLQTRHHPYFRRIWYLRHQLDAASPLVANEVKKRIRRCGHWPLELNDYDSVRASLVHFHDIIVTMNGTSNLTASDVFAQYRYKYRDLHVGWQFAGMMYFEHKRGQKEKKMKVDTALIHDILPQTGGGQEPIDIGLKND
uniref:Potassium channel domain-containing protein n=1 Tax=Odontella aurita TaxID=265563 RepID=A0A7S4JJR4_9STRA|mmetsp:Transcript_47551/g.143883  ORF Transcript_47551/g.143883 Transcript_47551/m.143883 type:complete len:595 (+) Transcript_47551:245-2029(+)|eukprot:CAMPEP_0113554998 /NCGR_PEP_ID=MMETSP0015_2-20120614/16467_1 /TAXON_ID=2838 /ORGANISM="Odontella" /LENGTH=594 /DNA_ID=CAMNT_0000456215 /DNA_START=157 /DNA_END=1941 /DNA_ORIENTATION=- /assembly_acc=CAM_ASM_000160